MHTGKNNINTMKNPQTYILTGNFNSGKTSFLIKLIEVLKEKKIKINGIYCPKVFENKNFLGFDVVDIQTNKSEPFLRTYTNGTTDKIGNFYIYQQGLKFGLECLKIANETKNQIVVIDEIGRLENWGKGWASELQNMLNPQNKHLILVINEEYLEEVIDKWKFKNTKIIKISKEDFVATANRIIREI